MLRPSLTFAPERRPENPVEARTSWATALGQGSWRVQPLAHSAGTGRVSILCPVWVPPTVFREPRTTTHKSWLGLSSASVIQYRKEQNPSAPLGCQQCSPPFPDSIKTVGLSEGRGSTRPMPLPTFSVATVGFNLVTNCPEILGLGANMLAPWLHHTL